MPNAIEEQGLTRLGVELQRVMDARGLEVEDLARTSTEVGYRIRPRTTRRYMIQLLSEGAYYRKGHFLHTLATALELSYGEAANLGKAHLFS